MGSDGEVDGTLFFSLQGHDGDDRVAANVLLDAGRTGSLGDATAANVRGDVGNDAVTLAVRRQAGSQAEVNAVVNGGFSLFDHDVGRHTTNVRTDHLEQDIVIQYPAGAAGRERL